MIRLFKINIIFLMFSYLCQILLLKFLVFYAAFAVGNDLKNDIICSLDLDLKSDRSSASSWRCSLVSLKSKENFEDETVSFGLFDFLDKLDPSISSFQIIPSIRPITS